MTAAGHNFLHHSPRLQTAVGRIALARHPHHHPTLLCTHPAAEATEGVCAEESVISLQPWKMHVREHAYTFDTAEQLKVASTSLLSPAEIIWLS